MDIDELIVKLQSIRSEFGNIPLYHWEENNEGYPELYYYDGECLKVKKIYTQNYISEYYDYHMDEVVECEKSEIHSAEFGEKLDKNSSNIHTGLIL